MAHEAVERANHLAIDRASGVARRSPAPLRGHDTRHLRRFERRYVAAIRDDETLMRAQHRQNDHHGISRSGSTITTALLLGVRGEDCAKISFLLSIPIILGAAVLASVTGYFCLILLDKMLKKAHFHRFAPYCIVVGLIAIVAHFVA